MGGWYLNPEANPLLPVALCIANDLLVKSRGPSTERKGRELGERWRGEGGEEEKEREPAKYRPVDESAYVDWR